MVHNLHFLCWKASYKANPSSHKVVQFPQLTWCVPLWDDKFREILGQYCFLIQVPMPGSFSCYQLWGVLCHFNFYLHSPPLWKAVFLVWKAHFWICDFHFIWPLWNWYFDIYWLLCPVFIQLICWNQQFGVELWHLKTCCLSTIHHLSESVPWGMGEGAGTKLQRPSLMFPSPSTTLTVSRKVQGFSKCTATTYIAHQD